MEKLVRLSDVGNCPHTNAALSVIMAILFPVKPLNETVCYYRLLKIKLSPRLFKKNYRNNVRYEILYFGVFPSKKSKYIEKHPDSFLRNKENN